MARIVQASLENVPNVGSVIQITAASDTSPVLTGICLSLPEARDLRNKIDLLLKEGELSKDQK